MSLTVRRLWHGNKVGIKDNYLYIWIKAGPWWSAGKDFGFSGSGYSVHQDIVEYASKSNMIIRIISGGNKDVCYEITAAKYMEFVNQYKSITTRGHAVLYVIPIKNLTAIDTAHDDIVEMTT